MREDMADLFHDCYRGGRRWDQGNKGEKRALQKMDPEEMPKRGSNHRAGRYSNYRIAPIARFLRSKVGQKWDDVYSEFAQVCDPRSKPQADLLEHVGPEGWMVEHNCQIIDDIPCDSKGLPLRGGCWGVFYIHPETKTLEIVENRRKVQNSRWKPKPFVKIDELNQYHNIDGIWYRVEFKRYTAGVCINDIVVGNTPKVSNNQGFTPYYWNHFGTHESSTRQTLIDRYGDTIYPIKKTQCNKKEIKKINAELERMAKAEKNQTG